VRGSVWHAVKVAVCVYRQILVGLVRRVGTRHVMGVKNLAQRGITSL
jgi:hypothetical protein